jgi:hypothetical protein
MSKKDKSKKIEGVEGYTNTIETSNAQSYDNKYVGQIDSSGKPHGKGIYYFNYAVYYKANWIHGERQGKIAYFYKPLFGGDSHIRREIEDEELIALIHKFYDAKPHDRFTCREIAEYHRNKNGKKDEE